MPLTLSQSAGWVNVSSVIVVRSSWKCLPMKWIRKSKLTGIIGKKSEIRCLEVSKSGCNGELLDLVMKPFPEVQEHICVKRIQSNAFETLKHGCRILQIDFAMLLLFATTRSIVKSVKVPVVEVAKRTNRSHQIPPLILW